eukprot:gene27281-33978_t
MKAAQYTANSEDSNEIKLLEIQKPTLAHKSGYALVKIHAASINPADFGVFRGRKVGQWPMPFPFTPGYDFSGVIDSVSGGDTRGFSVGSEVFAVNFGDQSHGTAAHPIGGAFAQYIAIPVSKLSHKPANVTHETAAALALAGSTALEALNTAQVTKGTKLLILGGSSATGLCATQLAKLKGAHVVTTASSRSLDFVKQFGADQVINYNEHKWWLQEETGLSGFDVIFDTVGEPEAFAHAKTPGLVKHGGKFISIANPEAGVDSAAHQPSFSYAAVFTMSNEVPVQDELIRLVSESKLVVPIEESFPFTQQGVWDLFEKVKGGKSQGKNILKIVQ